MTVENVAAGSITVFHPGGYWREISAREIDFIIIVREARGRQTLRKGAIVMGDGSVEEFKLSDGSDILVSQ